MLVALLAGLGFYRLRGRVRKDSGETSFLESRLQPDSFFGASGGQRIDTRDATGASSSMSYSLSQLDAIGDVDPVAEADVYLAYGRDLQAEEILKEAMRGNPERLAIRTKLLEVYAKRRDTKGFELLATQLYALTRGEGEDWAKAQELGRGSTPRTRCTSPAASRRPRWRGDGGRDRRAAGRQHDAAVGACRRRRSFPSRRRSTRCPRPTAAASTARTSTSTSMLGTTPPLPRVDAAAIAQPARRPPVEPAGVDLRSI